MNSSLVEILRCPACRGALTLQARVAGRRPHDVEEGDLRCGGCRATYPIARGVPRFPAAEDAQIAEVTRRTQRTYDYTWDQVGETALTEHWEKDSYDFAALIPASLCGGPEKIGLDAGCG